MLILRTIFLLFLLAITFSGSAEDLSSVKMSVGRVHFSLPHVFQLQASSEQLALEKKLKSIAERHTSFEEFTKEAKSLLTIPDNPQEECTLYQELELRLQNAEEQQIITERFPAYISQWFHKGYCVSGSQMIPISLFLREFYDDHKIGRQQARYDLEDLSFSKIKVRNKSRKNEEKIVRLTVEGEGFSESSAERAAIQEALGRVNAYWSNRTEATETSDGKEITSRFTETTLVIYGANVRKYDIISSVKTSGGKYKITINAEIEKNDGSRPQSIKTASLQSEYVRVANEYRVAAEVGKQLQTIPTQLINIFHKERIPDLNLIRMNCTVAVNITEYRNWIGRIKNLLGKIAVSESSFATQEDQLKSFFENRFSPERLEKKCLFIGDFKSDIFSQGYSTLQFLNRPETMSYRKYELRKTLIEIITKNFLSDPELVIELLNDQGNVLAGKSIRFESLGISFLQDKSNSLPVRSHGQIKQVPLKSWILRPFFFDRAGKSTTQFSFSVDLQLTAALYRKMPQIKVYLRMRPGNKSHTPLPSTPSRSSLEEAKHQYLNQNYAEAFRQLKPMAEEGNEEAVFYMGLLCYHWKKNAAEAVKWLSKSSAPFSQNLLGDILLSQKKYPMALEAYRKSAENENIKGMGRYGRLLLQLGHNSQSGVQYLKKAADAGNRSACYHLAEYYRKKSAWENAFNYYRKALSLSKENFKQYDLCMYYTGFCLAYGLGITKDTIEAVFYLNQVPYRSKKYGEAQYLSGILERKRGNGPKAIKHFEAGTQVKHPGSMFEYGVVLLWRGEKKALQYLNNAVVSQPDLAYSTGVALLKSGYVNEAIGMFKQCITKKNENRSMALFQLGRIYESMDKPDRELAIKYYKQASELNFPQASYALGMITLRSGKLEDCHKYLKKASGYPPADFAHGQLHENKDFSGFSLKEALFWYKKACSQSANTENSLIKKEAEANIQRIERQLQSVQY